MILRRIAAFLSVVVSAATIHGELAFAPHYTNHMVLQRETPIIVRGIAEPDERVTVTIENDSSTVEADEKGIWHAVLPSRSSGGPLSIVAKTNAESVRVNGVAIGDVWLCSGQSNMHWSLRQTDRGDEFIEKANNPNLRMLQIKKVYDRAEQRDIETIGWRAESPETAARFSAVGYHFGRLLHDQLGDDVPIGLIQSTWGGTPLEAWTPLPEITRRPDLFADRIKSLATYDLPEQEANRLIAEAQKVHEEFAAMALNKEIGEPNGWHTDAIDPNGWPQMPMRGYIEGELGSFNGVVWLRRDINLESDWHDTEAELRLGRIDDFDTTWVNGVKVGETLWDKGNGRSIERRYNIPPGVLRKGINTIAIRLLDVRSSGGIVPDNRRFELFANGVGREGLEGHWSYKVSFDAAEHGGFPLPGTYAIPAGRSFRRPAALYNAMIHPLTDFPIAGVIWYQGESNAGRGDEYAELFPIMIDSWREAWATNARLAERDFPFLFVQLPNYRQRSDTPSESSWAEVREAQRTTLAQAPRTGMAVTIDIGDPADIHPTNKLPVAERLAHIAMRFVRDSSDTSLSFSYGPIPASAKRDGKRVIIDFKDAVSLKTIDGSLNVKGFALAGQDGKFRWADAIIAKNTVIVSAEGVTSPTHVRYAWADNPDVNLVDQDGRPASPFQLHCTPEE